MTVRRHFTENLKSENIQKTIEKKPRKVIFAWNYLEWGGAQVYFLGIANRIKDRAEVKMILPKETGAQLVKFCENLQIPIQFLDVKNDLKPAPTLFRKIERHWNKFRAEYKLLKCLNKQDLRESIVHIELAPWQSLISLMRLCRKTIVFITMHNSLPTVSKWRFLLWKIKFAIITRFKNFHIFASNQNAKDSLKPLVSAKFLEKVKVTYTNVNPDEIDEALSVEIDREGLLKKFFLPIDKFLVFCVGQFIDRKGRWTFLEAARTIQEQNQDICFVWVSNSVLTEKELEQIKSYNLANIFYLLNSDEIGEQHIELFKFLRIADAFSLPSFVEGLPISLLEAMALGIPSISTNINAIPEAVKDLETGLLIEAGNSEALAAAILQLRIDKTLREKISIDGRKYVLENFNEKVVAEIAFSEYQKSIDNQK